MPAGLLRLGLARGISAQLSFRAGKLKTVVRSLGMLVVEASVRLLPHHHVLTSRFDSGHCFRPVIVRLDQVECLFEYLFTL
ncbi:hypothetical protein AC138_02610 [Pseudomonas putida]|nr:hypothetical protein AC138_02610 [Pseudomonas putida]KMY36899.1 hypothetical protein AA993_03465 [Pseudomonas putida]PXZ53822.1 hypothetical protein DM483_00040 [Pseudomonas sp. SMT-1]